MIPAKAESLALVVDDNEVFRNRLCRALEDRGWRSSSAGDGPAAIALAKQLAPDLAVERIKGRVICGSRLPEPRQRQSPRTDSRHFLKAEIKDQLQ